jgi:hypothetical protein
MPVVVSYRLRPVERILLVVQTLLVATTTPVETTLVVETITTVVETAETATILLFHRVLSRLQ